MCGIAGLAYADGERPVDPAVIGRMCEAVRHRGPDAGGAYVCGPVGLGMRRLSIIDLAGGRQPIFNEDRTKVIVFNGEIYNYQELGQELVARGHQLRTRSDTETVLHLYEEMGARCVERLRGMFALAIWDETRRALLLARDRFGIKPLYIASGPWGIAFASELKALCAVGLTGGDLDWDALDAYLQLGYIPAPASPFRAVRKLEPGHALAWTPSVGAVIRRYWDVPLTPTAAVPDAARLVRESLDQSVGAHLVSDVPIAAFLSGGLDSSAVVASMAHLGYATHAFTARYLGSGARAADETSLARQLAARWGVRLSLVDVHPRLEDCLEPIVYALDEPHADDSAIPTWWLCRAVGSHYRVALTGIGGEELFGGYRRDVGLVAGDRYARVPAALWRALAGVASLLPEPRGGGLEVDGLKRFPRANGATPPEQWLDAISRVSDHDRRVLYQPWLRDAVAGSTARRRFDHLWRDAGAPRGLSAGLYLDYKTRLADDVLALSDRLSMAHSLELRMPLVDHELAERVLPLVAALGPGRLMRKPMLRAAVRERLPDAHFRAPKRNFVGPTGAWLRWELRDVLLDELSADRLSRLGYFDPAAVRALLDDHLSRRRNREGSLWGLLCFSVWHRLYVERAPRPGPGAGSG